MLAYTVRSQSRKDVFIAILIVARAGIGDLAEGSMQTIFDLTRVAIAAIRSLFVVRSEDNVHPALAMIAPRGVFPQSGHRNRRQGTRDVSFAHALSVVGGYTGCGSGPP
jgi:hypothetical protein